MQVKFSNQTDRSSVAILTFLDTESQRLKRDTNFLLEAKKKKKEIQIDKAYFNKNSNFMYKFHQLEFL